jgi:uncharacterized Tic20 family protein
MAVRLITAVSFFLVAIGVLCVLKVTDPIGNQVSWILLQTALTQSLFMVLIYILWFILWIDARREHVLRYSNPFIVRV